jgi:hypothetical protein
MPSSSRPELVCWHCSAAGKRDKTDDRFNRRISTRIQARAAADAISLPKPLKARPRGRRMDERRPLPIPQISLENRSPNAFEGIAHYGPKLVVDAMAVLLEAMSGESFGTIANGGSERERAATVDSWRIYLYYQQGKRE